MTTGTYWTATTFKAETGINISDSIVENALEYAKREVRRLLFKKITYQTSGAETTHWIFGFKPSSTPYLDYYVADYSGDNTIGEDDLMEVIELDEDYDETDVSADIDSFTSKYGKLVFTTDYPTTDKTLRISFYAAKFPQDDMAYVVKEAATLFAVNYLFTKVPYEKLQKGISSWSLNGVNVTFDRDAMSETVKSNKQQLKQIYMEYALINVAYTTTRTSTLASMQKFKNTLTFV